MECQQLAFPPGSDQAPGMNLHGSISCQHCTQPRIAIPQLGDCFTLGRDGHPPVHGFAWLRIFTENLTKKSVRSQSEENARVAQVTMDFFTIECDMNDIVTIGGDDVSESYYLLLHRELPEL